MRVLTWTVVVISIPGNVVGRAGTCPETASEPRTSVRAVPPAHETQGNTSRAQQPSPRQARFGKDSSRRLPSPQPQETERTTDVKATGSSSVSIRGGADDTGHHYEWTIESNHSSPIVYVEFPHYRADLFTPPKGWTMVEMSPDLVSARADSVEFAIRPGHPGVFKMRIRSSGAARSVGGVRLRYEDGSESLVGGVTLPQPPSDKNIGLIGLGALFVIWVTLRRLKRKRPNEKPLS